MLPPSVYYWIRFSSTPEGSESDQYLLIELGALGAEEEEGAAITVKGSFADPALWSQARHALAGSPGLSWGESPWEDWDRSWRDRQVPVEVTPELVVCPPWVAVPAQVRHVIQLEAKMAFGTGSHASTRIAAMLLEGLDLADKTLLDVGTGTGILCLYAALRGAAFSAGFDMDPVTGPCLRENSELNPLPAGSTAVFWVGDLESLRPKTRFDVVICNMIRTEAWPHLEAFLLHLRPNGCLVISGQRVEDQSHWKAWFQTLGLTPFREINLDAWWGFALTSP
jgi:ribosomal protein L11 methyltransferase